MELFQVFTGVTPGEAGLVSANNYSASSPKMRFHAPLRGVFLMHPGDLIRIRIKYNVRMPVQVWLC